MYKLQIRKPFYVLLGLDMLEWEIEPFSLSFITSRTVPPFLEDVPRDMLEIDGEFEVILMFLFCGDTADELSAERL